MRRSRIASPEEMLADPAKWKAFPKSGFGRVYDAICCVCRFDPEMGTASKWHTRVMDVQAWVVAKSTPEQKVTARDVLERGKAWYENDKRGRRNSPPTPEQIRETWVSVFETVVDEDDELDDEAATVQHYFGTPIPPGLDERTRIVGQLVIKSFRAARYRRVPDKITLMVDVATWMDEIYEVPTGELEEMFRRALSSREAGGPVIAHDVLQEWREEAHVRARRTEVSDAVKMAQEREEREEALWQKAHSPSALAMKEAFNAIGRRKGAAVICFCEPKVGFGGRLIYRNPQLGMDNFWTCEVCGFHWDATKIDEAPYPDKKGDITVALQPQEVKKHEPTYEEEVEGAGAFPEDDVREDPEEIMDALAAQALEEDEANARLKDDAVADVETDE